jgi:hypothetical protein
MEKVDTLILVCAHPIKSSSPVIHEGGQVELKICKFCHGRWFEGEDEPEVVLAKFK